MLLHLEKKDLSHVYQTSIIQQTAFWSEVKKQQGLIPSAFDFKINNNYISQNKINKGFSYGDFLVLLQPINKYQYIAYVPYGPEIEPNTENQGEFLEELSESLRSFLPKECILIRYDLTWESHWANEDDYYDEQGLWSGPPEKKIQEFRLNFSTNNWNLKKANSDILPSNTLILNLNKNTDQILNSMKPKTRYNINLAHRKGITIKKTGIENLETWYALYKETAVRNNIYINGIEYFHSVLNAKAENSTSPAEVILLIAELDNEPLAAMFLVVTGKRGTYLYGASSSSKRNYMATYALQWEAMKIAKQKGCIDYDFFGVAPNPQPSHPLHGLYKFKIGFGGELQHKMGCWDYPLNMQHYNKFIADEMQNQGYHL